MPNNKSKFDRFNKKINFQAFRALAIDDTNSVHEKIGFPDEYRNGFEEHIYKDMAVKLDLTRQGISLLDIGCGCSDLAQLIIERCVEQGQRLYMLDSQEMLNLLPGSDFQKIVGQFPKETKIDESLRFDAILIYSVLQHVILDMNPFTFIDEAVSLLKPEGRLLIGDIPNVSKRNRFFSSEAGIRFHQEFTLSDTMPTIFDGQILSEKIDDSMVLAILSRYRNFGFDTYLVKQSPELPMSNRREDILIIRN